MISFGALSDLVENSKALNRNRALQLSLSRNDMKEFILEMNTNDQLFQGIDSTRTRLDDIGGSYAPLTIEIKKIEGLPFDRVTLFQTGDFYDTFQVHIGASSFTIEANTIKDGKDLQDDWGSNLLGLTDESLNFLVIELLPLVRQYILDTLLDF